jgi:hypothetical protein
MAPPAPQRAALEEHGRTNPRPIVDGIPADVKNVPLHGAQADSSCRSMSDRTIRCNNMVRSIRLAIECPFWEIGIAGHLVPASNQSIIRTCADFGHLFLVWVFLLVFR